MDAGPRFQVHPKKIMAKTTGSGGTQKFWVQTDKNLFPRPPRGFFDPGSPFLTSELTPDPAKSPKNTDFLSFEISKNRLCKKLMALKWVSLHKKLQINTFLDVKIPA